VNPPIVYHALAELELNDAAQYYEHECHGLGAALLTEVQRCSELIADHPEAGTPIHSGIRRRLVARFPYALLYAVRCVFRVIPATDSDRIRPPIPNESGHPFRGKWPPIPTKTATPHPEGAGSVLDAV